MPTYQTPGIYIEEISTGTRPIEAVGTSTAGFVGTSPNADAHVNEAFAVNSWSQFVKEYVAEDSKSTPLSQAVFGFFQNGGSRCYVVNIGANGSLLGDGKRRQGLGLLEEIDEVAIVAAPGFTDTASYDALLEHCERMQDRFAILDAPGTITNVDVLKKVGAAGKTKKPEGEGAPGDAGTGGEAGGARPRTSDRGYGAFYFPWIIVSDPFSPRETVAVPPSGHLAGIYARTDATRGVHKAPANESVRGALDLAYRITQSEQGELNTLGVNCLRFFPTQGIRVWGARTLADSASEWRYVPVRRLFNMIEESIARGTRWVVFEPNDVTLWKSIKRDLNAFLTLQWRQGALMGATAEEAFFVQCDEETNPPEVIDAGQVVAVIGIAPVKPAEFVIFRIGQSAAGTEIEGGI
ncbi:MAG TPA: phage tail sheath C-terminal domain-containing protein [Pyrinomonadaceae bacterium]